MGDVSKYQKNYKKWRYRLISSLGDILLEINPIGWDSKELGLVRNEKYFGIFRTYSAELEYIKNGYDTLSQLEENEGVLANCSLIVEEKNTVSGENTEVFDAQLDFSEYTETTNNGNGISLPLKDSEFLEKLKNRENIEIPYDRPEDLDGNTIDAGIYTDISLLGREFGGRALGNVFLPVDEGDDYNFYSFNNNASWVLNTTFENIDVLPDFQDIFKKNFAGLQNIDDTDCFYFQSVGTSTIGGTYNIVGYSDVGVIFRLVKAAFDTSGNIIVSTFEELIKYPSNYLSGNYNIEFDFSTTLEENEGLFIYVNAANVSGTFIAYSGMEIKIKYLSEFDPTPCKVALPHEVFDYMITAITGESGSFRSNYFGRTDIGYDEDGEGAYISLTNGKLIRGFETGYTTENEEIKGQLTFKFRELFENYYKLKNIAIRVFKEDGKWIVEAEKKIELFSDEIIHTITPDKDSLKRIRDIELYYSNIECGYNLAPDDLFGGLEEYNNKETYSTVLSNLENTFDLMCSYSASGIQIEKQRRKQAETYPTEEVTGDNYMFFVELINDETEGIIQRNEQGFVTITGLDNLETKINLGLTPKQILLEHGFELNSGLSKYASSSVKYNSSDKVTDLAFQRDSDESIITENADVIVGTLDNPIMTGFTLEFSAPLSLSDFIKIRSNPNGLIKVWSKIRQEYIYGWVKEVFSEPVTKPCNWVLYEANPPDLGTVKLLATNEDKIVLTNEDLAIQVT